MDSYSDMFADCNGTYIGIEDGYFIRLLVDEDYFCELLEEKTNGKWDGSSFDEMFVRPQDAYEAFIDAGLDPDKFFSIYSGEYVSNFFDGEMRRLKAYKECFTIEDYAEHFGFDLRNLMARNNEDWVPYLKMKEYYEGLKLIVRKFSLDSCNTFFCDAWCESNQDVFYYVWIDEEEAEEWWMELESEE